MSDSFWKKHWKYNYLFASENPQIRVARTVFGVPISEKNWKLTLDFLTMKLKLTKKKEILDLCCGNGLVSIPFAKRVKTVYAIDYSNVLIKELQSYRIPNIHAKCADANSLILKKNSFDIIILYFAIQHFNKKETIILLRKCKDWLKEGGQLYIGDIADEEKIWDFFNKKKYRAKYFEAFENSRPIIGNWFSKAFFSHLSEYLGFQNIEIVEQKKFMINYHYRFDVIMTK